MGNFLHEIKSLSDQEKKEEEGREGRDLKVRNQTLTPCFLVFGCNALKIP